MSKRLLISTLMLCLATGAAFAQRGGHGPGPGGAGGPGDGGDANYRGGNLIVADNGTVFVTRTVVDIGTNTSTTTLSAITTSGNTAWTITLSDRGRFVPSGSNLLTVSSTHTDTAVSSTITALSQATGATAWMLNVNGAVHELEPFSGGTYAIVVAPAATTGGTPTRSLIAISNAGAILWTVNL